MEEGKKEEETCERNRRVGKGKILEDLFFS
jgi:hypothetical protein